MPKTNHQKVQFSQEDDYSFADLHSEEAEQAVLGSILLDNNALDKIELEPDDFYISKHITIFREIKKLFDKGEKADIVTLAKPDEIEVSYLTELLSSVPTALHIQSYAEKVKDFALRRNLVEISEQQKSFALDPEVEDPISAAGKTLEQLDKHLGIEVKSPDYIIPDYLELLKLRKSKEGLVGILSGIQQLDKLTFGFKNKDLIVLASGSGIGKTTLALQFAHHAVITGKQVLYFCVEMGDSDLTDRLMANHFSIPFVKVRMGEIEEAQEKVSELKALPLFIIDDPSITIEGLRNYTSAYQRKYGIDMIVFDYLQLASDKGGDSETKRISDISRGLKKLAMELNIPVIALSQFSRDYEKENRTPSKKDLRWSGSIEQDSDMIMVLHRNKAIEDEPDCKDYSLNAKLWLEKNRQGKLGQVDLLFMPEFMRFEEVYNV